MPPSFGSYTDAASPQQLHWCSPLGSYTNALPSAVILMSALWFTASPLWLFIWPYLFHKDPVRDHFTAISMTPIQTKVTVGLFGSLLIISLAPYAPDSMASYRGHLPALQARHRRELSPQHLQPFACGTNRSSSLLRAGHHRAEVCYLSSPAFLLASHALKAQRLMQSQTTQWYTAQGWTK